MFECPLSQNWAKAAVAPSSCQIKALFWFRRVNSVDYVFVEVLLFVIESVFIGMR